MLYEAYYNIIYQCKFGEDYKVSEDLKEADPVNQNYTLKVFKVGNHFPLTQTKKTQI